MSQANEMFDAGIERYRAGEGPDTLLPVFKEICQQAPKNSSAWTCLAWLHLLDNQPEKALKAAKTAVKIHPQDPQARINLALAMLETKQKGVREHVEFAQQVMIASSELRQDVEENIKDGLDRKPDWKSLQKIKAWLEE